MSQIPVSSLTVLHPAGDLGQPVKLLLGLHPICMVGRDGCCSILFRGKKSNFLVSHKQIFLHTGLALIQFVENCAVCRSNTSQNQI
jgi:hypothetical protein